MNSSRRASSLRRSAATSRAYSLGNAAGTAARFVSVLFVIKGIELIFRISLAGFGIVPRQPSGLVGIAFSPLLHGNIGHLMANALPLFILMTLLFWDRYYHPSRTLVMVWAASGLGTWLIGRGDAVHVGASSIIFGLATYLIAAGFFMRRWRSVFIALLVLILFGPIFHSVLPQAGRVSWEGHLCGALAGLWAARKNHA